jgi:hypothetical protein
MASDYSLVEDLDEKKPGPKGPGFLVALNVRSVQAGCSRRRCANAGRARNATWMLSFSDANFIPSGSSEAIALRV